MKIIVDAFGGDNAPLEIIKGAADAVNELNIDIILCGDEEKIRNIAAENEISLNGIEIAHTASVLSMEDNPLMLMKEKKDCSMALGFKLLNEGRGDAFVSAGSTGGLVIGGNLIIKNIKGIKRAAIATVMPTNENPVMILDSGANIDCAPRQLEQFAVMGSIYMSRIMGVNNPTVALANIGTERYKGTKLQTETYDILEHSKLNFIGNAEVRDIPYGFCDVVVADGFTGNIILKMYEGVAGALMQNIKSIFKKSKITMLAALIVKSGLTDLKKKLDASEYGGAPLLGLAKPVIKAHGSSDAKAIKNAVKQAVSFVSANVIEEMTKNFGAEIYVPGESDE